MLLLQKLQKDLLSLSRDLSNLLRFCGSVTQECVVRGICYLWKKVEVFSLSLSCFLPPNSSFFYFLTSAQWIHFYSILGRALVCQGFSCSLSVGYCVVEGSDGQWMEAPWVLPGQTAAKYLLLVHRAYVCSVPWSQCLCGNQWNSGYLGHHSKLVIVLTLRSS